MQKKATNRLGSEITPKPVFSQNALEVILPEPLLELDNEAGARPTVVFRADYIGEGDPVLGARLLPEFLDTLLAHPVPPQCMLFYGKAVQLVLDGSDVLDTLRQLAGRGCEILACRTSLQSLAPGRQPAVGRATAFAELVDRMRQARILLWP